MTKTKSTKRALLMSVLSLMMCVSMLVGSTFAWFTDEVTSAGNIIKSGTLDVTMEWADGTKAVPAVDSNEWTDASAGAIFNSELWEPGYTEVRHIKIANEGTLALKYQLNIAANGEVSELADVIDVYYVDPATQVAERTALTEEMKLGTLTEVLAGMSSTASGELEAGEAPHMITIALKMQETAGNQYQDKAIGADFAVQLLATQLTSEADSFDNQYDANAKYDGEVGTQEELTAAIKAGGNYKLVSDITIDETITVEADANVSLNLNGKNIVVDAVAPSTNREDRVHGIVNNGTMTLSNGAIQTDDEARGYAIFNKGNMIVNNMTVFGTESVAYAICCNGEGANMVINDSDVSGRGGVAAESGAEVVINGGTYTTAGENSSAHVIYVYDAAVTINGGTFTHTRENANSNGDCVVYVTKDNSSSVTINDGTFDSVKGALTYSGMNIDINGGTYQNGGKNVYQQASGMNGIAEFAAGYEIVTNADGSQTVKPYEVSTTTDLAEKVAEGKNVVLSEDADLSDGAVVTVPENAEVVIDLNGKELTGGKQTENSAKSVYAIENKGTLTLKNGTVNSRGVGNYGTLVVEDGIYNAVDNNGGAAIWNYEGSHVTVNGGTFTAAHTETTPGAQAMWVASGATAVVNGGTFKSEADWTYAIISEGDLTINDADIVGEHGAIAADAGTLTINGGVYNISASGHTIYNSNATVTINGGTFIHSQNNATAEGNCVVYVTKGTSATVIINDGTFDSVNAALTYSGQNITIHGGNFLNCAANVYQQGDGNGVAEFVAATSTFTTNADGSVTVKANE